MAGYCSLTRKMGFVHYESCPAPVFIPGLPLPGGIRPRTLACALCSEAVVPCAGAAAAAAAGACLGLKRGIEGVPELEDSWESLLGRLLSAVVAATTLPGYLAPGAVWLEVAGPKSATTCFCNQQGTTAVRPCWSPCRDTAERTCTAIMTGLPA